MHKCSSILTWWLVKFLENFSFWNFDKTLTMICEEGIFLCMQECLCSWLVLKFWRFVAAWWLEDLKACLDLKICLEISGFSSPPYAAEHSSPMEPDVVPESVWDNLWGLVQFQSKFQQGSHIILHQCLIIYAAEDLFVWLIVSFGWLVNLSIL